MTTVRQRRGLMVLLVVVVALFIVGLALIALRQNINLYFTPSELVTSSIPNNQEVRVGGWVALHSVIHVPHSNRLHFQLTDRRKTISIDYAGLLPSLFREGQGVVVQGHWGEGRYFKADQVLAKHDANYHPPIQGVGIRGGKT